MYASKPKRQSVLGAGINGKTNNNANTHFQYFYDTFFIICDVDGFKHLTVLSSPQFPHNLIIILISEMKRSYNVKIYYYQQHSKAEKRTAAHLMSKIKF